MKQHSPQWQGGSRRRRITLWGNLFRFGGGDGASPAGALAAGLTGSCALFVGEPIERLLDG